MDSARASHFHHPKNGTSKSCYTAVLVLGLLVIGLCGCIPAPDKTVVVYSASDREYATPILSGFERSSNGTTVSTQFDVESSKTIGLVTRIEREKERPQCDVFWNNEIIHTIRLQQKGLLEKRRWPIPDNWPKSFRSTDGTWVGFAARARVLLINKSKLTDKSQWPSKVSELSDEKWKLRCGMASPLYGTTATHMAVLSTHPSESQPKDKDWTVWAKSVKSNAVILAGNKQVAVAVGNGELEWGLTDTDDAIIERESGKPVEIVFPDQEAGGFGTLFIPNSLCVLQRAPHPAAAASLADYLISEKVESRLTMGNSAQFPVWPTAKQRSRLETGEAIRWAEVDFEKAAAHWEEIAETLKALYDK